MAIAETKKIWEEHLKNAIKPFESSHMVKELGAAYVYELSLGGKEAIQAFKKGTKEILSVPSNFNTALEYNTTSDWRDAMEKVCSDYNSGFKKVGRTPIQIGPPLPGQFRGKTNAFASPDLSKSDDELVIQIYQVTKAGSGLPEKIMKQWIDEVWDTWVDTLEKEFDFTPGGMDSPGATVPRSYDQTERWSKSASDVQTGTVSELMRVQVRGDHREKSTRAVYALKELKEAKPSMVHGIDIEILDIISYLESELEIDYNEQGFSKAAAGPNESIKWEAYVEVRMGKGLPEKTDKKALLEKGAEIIEKRIADQIATKGLPPRFFDAEQSPKSKKEQILDSVIHGVVKKAKKNKRAKVSGNKGKKFQGKKVKTTISKKKKKKIQKQGKRIKIAGKPLQKRPEKGEGKETTTNTVEQLLKLKRYINRRLPAETRRNMGRPALINRTGRFSNSVKLLSLTEGRNSIMAKYTYLLSPYQTFENTGKKRWPLAYNPKPLIAKSIRNLAQGRIEQKITVRRV